MLIPSLRRCAIVLLAAGLIGSSACSSPAPEKPPVDTAGEAARARGTAIVSGRVPAVSGGMPSLVLLEPKDPREYPAQAAMPVMDQISQVFAPGVLIVRTGQPAEFRNSDETLHNIRVRNEQTKEAAFNIALPTGQVFTYAFQQDGFYDVGCDIHPAMSAVIFATKSPFAVLAAADGSFAIEEVPPGGYTLTVYADVRKIERAVEAVPGRTDVGTIAP